MIIQENFSLKSYNTLGVQSIARYYTEITTQSEIKFFSNKTNNLFSIFENSVKANDDVGRQ